MRIIQHNSQQKTKGLTKVNLKGVLIGNGVTDWTVDCEHVFMEFGYMHNLIDTTTYYIWRDNECVQYADGLIPNTDKQVCRDMMDVFDENIWMLNPYDIYRQEHLDWYNSTDELETRYVEINGEVQSYQRGILQSEYTPWIKSPIGY